MMLVSIGLGKGLCLMAQSHYLNQCWLIINKIFRDSYYITCEPMTIQFTDTYTGLILGLHPANERRRYFVTASLIGWAQA